MQLDGGEICQAEASSLRPDQYRLQDRPEESDGGRRPQ